MNANLRAVAIVGGIAALAAGALGVLTLLPAVADDGPIPVVANSRELFPGPRFDPKSLVKFDIVLDDSVSTEVLHRQTMVKIGFGKRQVVSIVTTPTGTYSSDALTSPNVRYPGVEVTPIPEEWPSFPRDRIRVSTSDTPWGKSTSLSVRSGSFTYYQQIFTPVARRHAIW